MAGIYNVDRRGLLQGFAALWAALAAAAPTGALAAPKETVLYSFTGGSDGATPVGSLIADSSGNFYGTTAYGGIHSTTFGRTSPCFAYGCGVVFQLSRPASEGGAWTEKVLHAFTGRDGANPGGSLIFDSSGNLFGTAALGGTSPCEGYGCGVVFKLSPPASGTGAWTEAVLHAFTGGSDGSIPEGSLVIDSSGNLYSTTSAGGPPGCSGGCGVVFKLSSPASGSGAWTETVVHTFMGSDGDVPEAPLITDSSGNLYGTTLYGGAGCTSFVYGCGVVFKLSPPVAPGGAWTETVLHAFTRGSDGSFPSAGLIADRSGNLYGTTSTGGVSDDGVVFKFSPATSSGMWTETVLHSFKVGSDGGNPVAGVIADASGNLYGGTPDCGPLGRGVVFKLSPPSSGSGVWTETVLHRFTGGPGCGLSGTLVADSDGNLYGATGGGASGNGTVIKLTDTGFVTAVPFSAFSAKLEIHFGSYNPRSDDFNLSASFTLGSASNGINPPAEPVTIKIGTFTITIPAGSFKGSGFGPFQFEGVIEGVRLDVAIEPTGAKRYAFQAVAQNANLEGTANPVPVTLDVGDNSGTTSVNAHISPGGGQAQME